MVLTSCLFVLGRLYTAKHLRHEFIKTFVAGQRDDPMEKRERFAISLRMEKKRAILAKKRTSLYSKTKLGGLNAEDHELPDQHRLLASR